MHILILHRVPDTLVRYAEAIDHDAHQVTYVGVPERLATVPAGVPCRRLSRPGTGDTATEVLAAIEGLPRPDRVIALSEYDLLAAAKVREVLGLPGPHEEQAQLTRDKVRMKAAVAAHGLRVPRYLPLAEALTGGPTGVPWTGRSVLKPRAGATSEGVLIFDGVAPLLDHAATLRDPALVDDFELEEFVEGPILHIDGLVADGKPVTVVVSRYVDSCLAFAQGRPVGSVQLPADQALVDWTMDCLAAVAVETGPFHLEAIETPGGPVFLEVGARFGGADIVDTFELATGVHLPTSQLRLLVDGPGRWPDAREPGPDEQYGWFVLPGHQLDSRYCRIDGEREFRDDALVHRWVQHRPDEPVTKDVTYTDTENPLAGIVGPAPAAELERFLTRMFATVTVTAAAPPA